MATIGIVAATAPTAEDTSLRARLLARGHEVDFIDHLAAVPNSGYTLYVLTSSATELESDDKYRLVEVPIVSLNVNASDELGLSNGTVASGTVSTQYALVAHEITTGLVSPAAILETGQTQEGRTLPNIGSGAKGFAKAGNDPTVYTGWSFAKGKALVGGTPAPARRVALTFPNSYLSSGTVTEVGWSLFDRSVDWALNVDEFAIDGTEVMTWVGPDGYQIQLNVQWDVDGRYMPPVEFREEEVPNTPGLVLRGVRHGAREITVPVWIVGSSHVDLSTKIRSIVASMDPTRGPGTLQATAPDGSARQLRVRYLSGLSMPEKLGDSTGLHFQYAKIVFRAHLPYWEDVAVQAGEWSVSDPVPFFPIFPMYLSASTIVATVPIVNDGDVIAWPTWKIVGPGSAIALINQTTGEKIDFSNNGGLELGVGEWIDIDTTEGVKSVRLNNGDNLFSYLTTDSSLWHLERGTNNVSLAMGDADNANSKLVLNYRRRYLSI
jgi:hypothetical protein